MAPSSQGCVCEPSSGSSAASMVKLLLVESRSWSGELSLERLLGGSSGETAKWGLSTSVPGELFFMNSCAADRSGGRQSKQQCTF